MLRHCRGALRLAAATTCCVCVLGAIIGCESTNRQTAARTSAQNGHVEQPSASPDAPAKHAPGYPAGFVSCHKGIDPGFPTGGWTFFTGTDGLLGDPIEAFLELCAGRGETLICVETPQDLVHLDGLVFESESDALALVELFTKTDMFYLFDWPDALSIDCSDDSEDAKAGHVWIAPEYVESCGYTPATVTRDGNGFIVHRYLLKPVLCEPEYPIIAVEERVGRDGRYTLRTWVTVGSVSRWVASVPYFE